MTAFLLVIPWIAVRHIVPVIVGGDSVARAAHVAFGEKDGAVRAVYDFLTIAVVLFPLALSLDAEGVLLVAGIVLYAVGLTIEARAMWDFCHLGPDGFSEGGVFRVSRNPMYVSYLLVLLGIAALTVSPVMFVLALGFQVVAHRLVLAEERWCLARYGRPFEAYMGRVRRYL